MSVPGRRLPPAPVSWASPLEKAASHAHGNISCDKYKTCLVLSQLQAGSLSASFKCITVFVIALLLLGICLNQITDVYSLDAVKTAQRIILAFICMLLFAGEYNKVVAHRISHFVKFYSKKYRSLVYCFRFDSSVCTSRPISSFSFCRIPEFKLNASWPSKLPHQ